jgi:hypothetical protein
VLSKKTKLLFIALILVLSPVLAAAGAETQINQMIENEYYNIQWPSEKRHGCVPR